MSEEFATQLHAEIRKRPGVTTRELHEAHPYAFVEGALEVLHERRDVVFDEAGNIFPGDITPTPRVAAKFLAFGRGTVGGGGIDSFLMRQAVRENPSAAAFEITQLREQIKTMRAANESTPKYNIRALAASFHSYPGDVALLPDDRGSPIPAFEQIYVRAVWGKLSNAERHVVAFLHYVWNGSTEAHRQGSRLLKAEFNFGDAMASWDEKNTAAFVAWCQDRWFM